MPDVSLDSIRKDLTQAFVTHDAKGVGYIERNELARLLTLLDSDGWDSDKIDALLYGAGLGTTEQRVDYSKFISWLVQDALPIKQRHPHERAAFLQNEWAPFIAEAKAHLDTTRRRHESKFSLHEVMPAHFELAALATRCMQLTVRWHGRPNVSALYEIFMEMAEMDGHSPYLFRDLPQQRSADGYTRVIDAQARQRLYSGKPAIVARCSVPVGCMPQNAGESPIDNLELPNIMYRRQALLLMSGNRVQQFLVRTIQWKQRRLLDNLGLSGASTEARVKERVQEFVTKQRIEGSLAYDALAEIGVVLESYGQLSPESRMRAEDYLVGEIGRGIEEELPCGDVGEELQAFVLHCQQHPGRAYGGSTVQHKLMLFRAIANPSIRVLWRSDVERFTQHKYFSMAWTRKVPLMYLPPVNADTSAAELVVLRPAGAEECTRFRKNVFAYGESHGLGQSGGGWTDSWRPGTLMYELGALLCADEAAKVPNHWLTDIEKIIKDCVALCPHGGITDALPGEVLHDVGQNPVIASSIGPTQHTQATRASADDFPLIAEQCCPKWIGRIAAWVDIVQVGESEDAIFISARSRYPDGLPFLQFLIDMRVRFLQVFGGSIDFNMTCHPTSEGEFITIFTPLACMKKIKVPKGEGVLGSELDFENPDLGEVVTKKRLAAATVDCSHGKGNVLAMSDNCWRIALEGRSMLGCLYDFNRKPGARLVAQTFLNEVT